MMNDTVSDDDGEDDYDLATVHSFILWTSFKEYHSLSPKIDGKVGWLIAI